MKNKNRKYREDDLDTRPRPLKRNPEFWNWDRLVGRICIGAVIILVVAVIIALRAMMPSSTTFKVLGGNTSGYYPDLVSVVESETVVQWNSGDQFTLTGIRSNHILIGSGVEDALDIAKVAIIIHSEMVPQRGADGMVNPHITPDEAALIANEIFYWMIHFQMAAEDLPYILSLFYGESKFDPRAVHQGNISNATGIGQLLKMHWDDNDPTDIEFNIQKAFEIFIFQARYSGEHEVARRWEIVYLNYTGTATGRINARQAVSKFKGLLDD